jgi:hypothetical protein
MTLGSGWQIQQFRKKLCSTHTFRSLLLCVYDHHRKIMSYTVMKKMTLSVTPDHNEKCH